MDAQFEKDIRGSAVPSAMDIASKAGVCVAICTRNRTEHLCRALRSVMAQTFPPDELLVVDNAPDGPSTQTMVREEFPGARYVREPIQGLDFARNRALVETSMEIVAFIDDDAVAGSGWVEAIRSVFLEGDRIAICTGKVEALSLQTEGERLFEANGGFARGDDRIRLPADRRRRLHGLPAPLIAWAISVGSGCSLAVRRKVILGLGGFDEALDLGSALPGGGDLDILWRALDGGYEIVYEPSVQAYHEHRKQVEAVVTQILEHHRSLIAMLTKASISTRSSSRAVVLVFLLWRLLKPGVRLLRRMVGRDPLPGNVLLRMWGSCLRGLGSYPAASSLAKRRRSVEHA